MFSCFVKHSKLHVWCHMMQILLDLMQNFFSFIFQTPTTVIFCVLLQKRFKHCVQTSRKCECSPPCEEWRGTQHLVVGLEAETL